MASRPAFDAIVVLGAALDQAGGMSPALAKRVETGIQAYRDGAAPLLIMSGGKTGPLRAEAEAMAERAYQAGLAVEVVLLEDRSLNTWQNAAFVKELVLARKLERLLLVSDAVHLPRARAIFRLHHMQTRALPAKGRIGNPFWEAAAWGKFLLLTARDFAVGRLPRRP